MDHCSDGAQTLSQSNTSISDTAIPLSGESQVDLAPSGLETVSQHSNLHLGSELNLELVSRHSSLHLGSGLIPEPVSNLHLGSGLIPELVPKHSNLHLHVGSGFILESASQHSNVNFDSELVPHSLLRHSSLHHGSDVIPHPAFMSASVKGPDIPQHSSEHLPFSAAGSGLPQWSSGHLPPVPVAESGLPRQSNVDLRPAGSHAQLVKGAEMEGGDDTATEAKSSDVERQSFSDANSFSQTTFR